MKRLAPYLFAALALLLTGCRAGNSVLNYWDGEDIVVTESGYQAAEDRFARYAELLVAAPKDEADEALEGFLERIKEDEVSYYVYAEWLEAAFHSCLSPCRNPRLFGISVKHLTQDGILSKEELARLSRLAVLDNYNLPGQACTLPQGVQAEGPALYLVLNLDCRSCREALTALAGEHPEAEHIALCFGYSPIPDIPGWEYIKPESLEEIFELDAAPFWFLTAADGTVATPYCAEFEAPHYAKAQAL